MSGRWPEKDPLDTDIFHVVWCDETGINTGGTADHGALQSATISTVTWTIPTGITSSSNSTAAITIHSVSYPTSTVCSIWISGGTVDTDYTLTCKITTSDSRTLYKTAVLPIRTA
jgi:hypothetical protein